MTRTLWINPVFGVAGDMLLAGLLDLGAPEEYVRSNLATLELDGWDLRVETVTRRGLVSRRAHVSVETDLHRPWSEIDRMLAEAPLPEGVVSGSRETFLSLAEVEASRHGIALDEVTFHEVGAVDAIIDIAGCWLALAGLDVDRVVSGPVGLGVGALSASHGPMPHPAPAVLGLLEGLPVTGVDTRDETATPTGVALLKTMVDSWGPIPAGRLLGSGYGAGGRDPESHANLLSVSLLADDEAVDVDAVIVETNVDDVTPESVAYVVERALASGADDAWVLPIMMKKGRPGHQIRLLCPPGLAGALTELLAEETQTLGIRTYPVAKLVYPRTFDTVVVYGHEIIIKSGPYGAKPEFEDVRRAAIDTGRPLHDVSRAALAEWRAHSSGSLDREREKLD